MGLWGVSVAKACTEEGVGAGVEGYCRANSRDLEVGGRWCTPCPKTGARWRAPGRLELKLVEYFQCSITEASILKY